MFDLPFMQRALLAGAVLGLVLPFLGIFVTLRRMSFMGDGIAHATLAGIAIGITAGIQPFATAVCAAIVFGAGIYFLERKTEISSDALIGVLFPGSLALGIVLISRQRGYQPELLSFLFGSILSISPQDLIVIAAVSAIILVFLLLALRQLTLLSLDRDAAWLGGVRTGLLEFGFYLIVSVAIVLGVKLLGIILVSALLIIPPTIARMIASSFRRMVVASVLTGEVCIVLGLALSYRMDLPSGATIVLTAVTAFLTAAAGRALVR